MRPQTATRHGHRQNRPGPPLSSSLIHAQFCAARAAVVPICDRRRSLSTELDLCSSGSHESPHLDASMADFRDADAPAPRRAMSSWSFGGHRCQRARLGESISRRGSRHLPGASRDRCLGGAARLESGCQPAAAETSTVVAGRGRRGARPWTRLWRRVDVDARGRSSTHWTGHDRRCLCPGNRGTRRAAAIRLTRCSLLVARCSLLVAR